MAASIDLSFLTVQVLSALRQAAFLFLISSGLTLIFGVLNILNFAHGALYMLGAYFIYALTLHLTGPAGFLIALLAAPLGVAVIAVVIETGLLRRIYRQEEIYQLLLTYSLVLIIDDLAKIVFGPEYKSIPKPDAISGAVTIFGGTVPVYTLVVLVLAPMMALVLWYLLYKTRTGKIVRATSSDREMADALGINMSALFTLVFAFGAMLAGFAGALSGPARTVFPGVGTEVIIESFVVVVIGGLGNLWGALIGSILIGTLETVGIIVFPEFEMSLIYLLMVAILVSPALGALRAPPQGEGALRQEPEHGGPGDLSGPLLHPPGDPPDPPGPPADRSPRRGQVLPVPADPDPDRVAGGGRLQPSAGDHRAALLRPDGLLRRGGLYRRAPRDEGGVSAPSPRCCSPPSSPPLAAGVIGFFCVRLSGVHFAMLTLAFGQLVYTIAFKWYGFTGGDNGIQGIPIRPLPGGIDIGSTKAMYYFALAVVGISVECLRRIRSSPFGATLKAIRENSQRAAYLGVNVKLYQWAAFVIAGAFTGLAGGLYAVMEKSITPDIIHWTKSGEPVFMTIIGGIYSFAGPVVGAGVFVVLNSYLVAWTEKWALVLGIILLVMVLLLPGGVVGFINEKARGALSKRGWVRKWVFSK